MLLQLNASNTVSTLGWKLQVSDDQIDWYEADQAPVLDLATPVGTLGIVQHASSSVIHQWQPTASTSRKIVNLSPTNAQYGRIIFSALGDNVGVWAKFIAGFATPN